MADVTDVIYLDNNATTRVAPEVVEAMMPAFGPLYGNASSMHTFGGQMGHYIQKARAQVAGILNADPEEIIFTSCGSESDNSAWYSATETQPEKRHVITTKVEHSAVLAYGHYLEDKGYEVTWLGVDDKGRLNLEELERAIRPDTALVSMMYANNETGTIFPIEDVARIVKAHGVQLHVDAVQAWMRVPIKLDNIDTLAVSGHKIHAPKGIGALYLSDRLVQAFQPPYLGGEQERGLRPGTENLPYAMGLAAAAARLAKTMKSRDTAMRALNQRLRDGLAAFPEVVLNSPADAVPEVLNFSENCIKSETMLAFLAEAQIYVSSASACGRGQPSHTLAAMGRDPLAIDTAIRVSFCADNTPEDVDAFLNRFEDGMKLLQRIKK